MNCCDDTVTQHQLNINSQHCHPTTPSNKPRPITSLRCGAVRGRDQSQRKTSCKYGNSSLTDKPGSPPICLTDRYFQTKKEHKEKTKDTVTALKVDVKCSFNDDSKPK